MDSGIDAVTGRVLVVDDEKPLARMIATYLTRAGYDVATAHTGPDAVEAARSRSFDVVVLDLGLPGLDGIEVCRRIRGFSECYVLMLTARGDEDDKLAGLAAGADDYITKPFSVRELVARVAAVLRRPRTTVTAVEPARVFGDLTVDLTAHEARVVGEPVGLTRTEFDLLAALTARPHQALSRRQLIDTVWDPAWVGDERLVDVHIGHLRRKLSEDQSAYIDTVRGVGYRMVSR
ncbi:MULTISPECIES: response regulator transcription factor [Kocuria]|jgi:DNA-binding response OmpR family regulator|uniref:response regulator transcription factor n=1 Tax=Kocuria TaxID=57493 RepID=UPI00064AE030|nr:MULTISPECIES: response regulator transcription factor [Kocuria]KLU08994.1 PhoR family transcriptional regulator [Kocuria sp. SM24M-10]NVC23130.1 response regulator transcription factor [Kocuria salina]OLT06886.1 DNA-binding response regulator [Kocuria sp. CNJ-770]PAU86412.1 DNA-binding response regulator [Kocuria sp. WN036]PWF79381.1 DNA-binding response regulator [Kocuria rosea]